MILCVIRIQNFANTPTLPGFCKSATTDEIAQHGYVLTPGRYVGAEQVEDEGELFEEKMTRLVNELNIQFSEGGTGTGNQSKPSEPWLWLTDGNEFASEIISRSRRSLIQK